MYTIVIFSCIIVLFIMMLYILIEVQSQRREYDSDSDSDHVVVRHQQRKRCPEKPVQSHPVRENFEATNGSYLAYIDAATRNFKMSSIELNAAEQMKNISVVSGTFAAGPSVSIPIEFGSYNYAQIKIRLSVSVAGNIGLNFTGPTISTLTPPTDFRITTVRNNTPADFTNAEGTTTTPLCVRSMASASTGMIDFHLNKNTVSTERSHFMFNSVYQHSSAGSTRAYGMGSIPSSLVSNTGNLTMILGGAVDAATLAGGSYTITYTV